MLYDDEQPLVVVDGSVRRKRELDAYFQLRRDDTAVLRQLETATVITYELKV